MKTSSEYRAEGFRTWRRFAKASALIALVQIIMNFFNYGAAKIIAARFSGDGTRELVWKLGINILLLCTVGLLYYYVPVWFMAVRRGKSLIHSDLSTNYGRALLVSAAVMLPELVSDVWKILESLGAKDTLGRHIVTAYGALFSLYVIWPFAVGITLPLRAYDHPEVKVNYLVQTNKKMMNGYKWKLFTVSFRIWFWPVVIFAVSLIVCILARWGPVDEALSARGFTADMLAKEEYVQAFVFRHAWKQHAAVYLLSGFVMLLELAAFQFIVSPAWYFANIAFYEDLLAERGGDFVEGDMPQPGQPVIPENSSERTINRRRKWKRNV